MATINGTAGNDTLAGTSGNDTINALEGNDIVVGASGGDDVVHGGAGFDSIEFRTAATSALIVNYAAATITGGGSGTISFTSIERVVAGNFNDVLDGTTGGQNLTGQAGNDTLWGAAGVDTLWGGSGNDAFIFRETGSANADGIRDFSSASDKLWLDRSAMAALGVNGNFAVGDERFASNSTGTAQDANDRVIFQTGTGQVWYDADGSGAGARQLIATLQSGATLAATNIVVVGDAAPGMITGTEGDDTLVGSDSGDDTIDGLGGNDVLIGNNGADSLRGGDGNDTLFAGEGAGSDLTEDSSVDTLDGGLGDDVYHVSGDVDGDGDVLLADPGGIDTVIAWNSDWTLGPGFENLELADDLGVSSDGTGNELDNRISGATEGGTLLGLGGNDTLIVRIAHNSGTARGGDGNDTIFGGSNFDSLFGDDGNDLLVSAGGGGSLAGGAGADIFFFNGLRDSSSDPRHEVTDFAPASDTIRLDAIVMPALGASGRFAAGDARFAANSSGSAQDSSDRVVYNITTGELWYDADGSAAGEALLIAALSGAPSLAATDIEVVNGSASSGQVINGTAGDDSIVGTAGDDTIAGLAGDDTLDGSGGSDRLEGGDGDDLLLDDDLEIDTLNGGLGNDTYDLFNRDDPGRSVLVDAGGIDTVISRDDFYVLPDGLENLVVEGALGGEGNALDNRIVAGEPIFSGVGGGRALDGADGDDTLIGSRSEDEFWFSAGSGNYGNDSVDGDDGFDMLHFDDARSAVVADMQAGTASGGGNGGSGSVTFTHIVGIVGGAFGDHLTGHNGILVFDVEIGSHVTGATLMGLGGDDTLLGGDHHDFLAGGEGDDRIAGGAGLDSLWGDAGNDAFIFDVTPAGENRDDIGDFSTGSDQLHFDNTVYTSLGAAGAFSADDARFAANATGTAQDASDRLIYDTTNGALVYDADGTGAEEAQLVTFLQGPSALTATDIVVFGDGGGNTIVGTEGDDTLVGTPGNDIIDGRGGNDSLVGGDGADQMIGGDGNDTLQGFYIPDLSGSQDEADTMDGGLGNDEFWVDHPDDVISDSGGIDTVYAGDMDWTLGAGYENLVIWNEVSEDYYNAIGNELNNVIRTTENGSRLEGRGGDDTLTSYGAWTQSDLFGGDGNDSLAGWGRLEGGVGNDTLVGSGNEDTLDGGADADNMNGGEDDDLYIVTPGDVLSDSGGTDTVQTGITWSLGTAFENLTMTGTGNITMQGNNLNNLIIGNAGNNTFNARAGDDTIMAGGGNDRIDMFGNGFASYGNEVVDGGAGIDNIDFSGYAKSGIVVNLATGQISGGGDGGLGTVAISNVERVITGAFNDRFTGNSGANTFDGRGGNDTLSGGGGNDTLTGGTGNDFFVFDTAPGSGNVERVTDFSSAPDQLQFENAVFTAIGGAGTFAASDGRFWAAAGATSGHDANDRVVYNVSTGSLYYDADGSGAGASQLVATFQGNPAIAATDITVI